MSSTLVAKRLLRPSRVGHYHQRVPLSQFRIGCLAKHLSSSNSPRPQQDYWHPGMNKYWWALKKFPRAAYEVSRLPLSYFIHYLSCRWKGISWCTEPHCKIESAFAPRLLIRRYAVHLFYHMRRDLQDETSTQDPVNQLLLPWGHLHGGIGPSMQPTLPEREYSSRHLKFYLLYTLQTPPEWSEKPM